jgi:hypothetical protein
VQRFIAINGAPKYFIYYEVSTVSVLSSQSYMDRQNNPTEWTLKAMPQFRNNSRTVCETVWQSGVGVGGVAATFRFAPAKGREAELVDWLTGTALVGVMGQEGVVCSKLWQADRDRTTIPSTVLGLRGAPDNVADWIALVSGNLRPRVEEICSNFLSPSAFVTHGATSAPLTGLYQLIFAASA